jgi:hypothetical protein
MLLVMDLFGWLSSASEQVCWRTMPFMADPTQQPSLPPDKPHRPNHRREWIAFWSAIGAALLTGISFVIAAYVSAGSHVTAGPTPSLSTPGNDNTPPSATTTAPATTPISPLPVSNGGSCTFGARCVAADGTLTGGAFPEQYVNDPNVHVAGLNTPPATVTMVVQDIPAAGAYTLSVWYENNAANDGLTEPRDMTLLVNGQLAGALNFAVTNSWSETNSKVTTTTVQVPSGSSTFAIACQADDSCHINVWEIELS